ncbi:MAG: type II secretion system GspH family protein [Ruminococcus sp.]|nr:type II secretion system GspH family protein [Ruminococcus sp.]
MRKNTKGFTLVELVVVIAIVGVLAAMLVPTMLNYIRKAKLRAANTNAKTAYHGVVEFFTERNALDGSDMDTVLSDYGQQVIDCNIPPQSALTVAQKRIHDILATNGINSGHVWVDKTKINGLDAVYVQWTGDSSANNKVVDPEIVVGQYPDPITWDTYRSQNNNWRSYVPPV